MKRILLSLSLLLTVSIGAQAQIYFEEETDEQELSFWDRTYFGGNFALSFGRWTYIDISPLMGYMVNEDFSVGVGASYIYLKREFNNFGNRFEVSNSVYGGRTFLRQRVYDSYFLHAEFESVNNEFPDFDNGGTTREWVPGLFIGGGLFQPAFGRGGVSFFVMYNLLHDDIRSPYGSAWVVRAGFTL